MAKMLYAVVGLACGIALVATCGSSSIKKTIMTDLGIAPADAQASAPSMVLTGNCDKVVKDGSSALSVWSEISAPGVQPSEPPHVTAVVCGIMPPLRGGCTNCTGYTLPPDGCGVAAAPIIAQDKIVVACPVDPSQATSAKVYVRVN